MPSASSTLIAPSPRIPETRFNTEGTKDTEEHGGSLEKCSTNPESIGCLARNVSGADCAAGWAGIGKHLFQVVQCSARMRASPTCGLVAFLCAIIHPCSS